tara:strand:+ start:1189 stop:2076 length:888 start_codon:yes stop_codon:yes gene_type:complete
MGVLLTGVASGASASWSSSVGGRNSRVRTAYYQYEVGTEEEVILTEAKDAFLNFLIEDSSHPRRIQSDLHGVDYLYVMLDNISAKVIKPGIVALQATYGGSAQQPQTTGISSDTVMIYTKGAVDALYGAAQGGPFGFPDESLLNQVQGEDPLNINLEVHRIDAFQRTPFTRGLISYKPTILDYRGALAQGWANVVGKTNANTFIYYMGDDYGPLFAAPNRVRLNGLTTVPKPLISKDKGIAWMTQFDFTICSTQFVDQAIEVNEEETSEGDTENVGKIIYLDQYQRVRFPNWYTP